VSVLIPARAGIAGGLPSFSAFREISSRASGGPETPSSLMRDFSSLFLFMVTLFLLDFGFAALQRGPLFN
jgi:hypothetical protein